MFLQELVLKKQFKNMLYICTNHIHLNNDMFLCFSLKRNKLKHLKKNKKYI